MANRHSRIVIPAYAPSYDGRFHGRWPYGDKPSVGAELQASAASIAHAQANLQTLIRMGGSASDIAAAQAGLSTAIRLAGQAKSVASATGSMGGGLSAPGYIGGIGDDVSGTLLALSGEDFGAAGPTNIYYDDFRDVPNGSVISTPVLGSPSILSSGNGLPIVDTTQPFAKGRAMRVKDLGNTDNRRARINWGASNGAQSELCFSFWIRSEKGDADLAAGGFKVCWELTDQGADLSGDGLYDVCWPTKTSAGSNGWDIGGNSTVITQAAPSAWLAANQWRRVFVWHDLGNWYFQIVGASFFSASGAGVDSGTGFQPVRQLNLAGYLRSGSDYRVWMALPYIASSPARVEVGNAQTYSNCSLLYLTTTTSWSNGAIGITNRLPFNAAGWYYHIHKAGNVHTNGGVGRLIS